MQTTTSFTLTISKVNERVFQGDAVSVTLPGTEGEFTVLAHHEPLITLLKQGIIIVRTATETLEFPIEKGVFEASHGHVTLLI